MRYPKEIKDNLIEDFRQGASHRTLIDKYGVSDRTIDNWTRGVTRNTIKTVPIETILDMKNNRKKSNADIAREIGVTSAAVTMRLKRYYTKKGK